MEFILQNCAAFIRKEPFKEKNLKRFLVVSSGIKASAKQNFEKYQVISMLKFMFWPFLGRGEEW